MKTVIYTIVLFTLLSCQNNKTRINIPTSENKTEVINKHKFLYKDIIIDKNPNDTIQPKNIKELFGVWKIDSIADIGGTMESEELIQSQIGKELIINDSQLSLHILNENLKINNPNYSILKRNDAKCTSFWYGYKGSRNFVTLLKLNESYYLEIVNNHELAYYYDGRIYFFKR